MSGLDLLQLAALSRSGSRSAGDYKRSLLQLHANFVATSPSANRTPLDSSALSLAGSPSSLPPKKRFKPNDDSVRSRPSPPSSTSAATVVSAAGSQGSLGSSSSLDSEWTDVAIDEATNERQGLLQLCDSTIGDSDSFIVPSRRGLSSTSVATVVSAASSQGSSDSSSLNSEWTEGATAEATNENQDLLQLCDSVIGESFVVPNREGTARGSASKSKKTTGGRGWFGDTKCLTDVDGNDLGMGYFSRRSPALVTPTLAANAREENVPTSLRSAIIERGAGQQQEGRQSIRDETYDHCQANVLLYHTYLRALNRIATRRLQAAREGQANYGSTGV